MKALRHRLGRLGRLGGIRLVGRKRSARSWRKRTGWSLRGVWRGEGRAGRGGGVCRGVGRGGVGRFLLRTCSGVAQCVDVVL